MLLSKERRKSKFTKLLVIVSICLLSVSSFSNVIHANAASRRNEKTATFIFLTPKGQTATVNAKAIVTETYNASSSSNNTYTKRDCFLCYNRSYAASAPQVTRGNGIHKASVTGKTIRTFSSWKKGSYLWDVSVHPYGEGAYNTTSVTYAKTTPYVSGFPYTVYCEGSVVPTQAGSVYVTLKTQ